MLVVFINYKKSIEMVDKYLSQHRDFLEEGYKQNFFIVSGPQIPRTGGIIISQLKDRSKLEEILSKDPFQIYDIADYEIIEFTPVKYHQNFLTFVE
jgi:uncharacterized protein YciI